MDFYSILLAKKVRMGSTNVAWGSISGTLSDQTDLQDALNDKQDELVNQQNIKSINGNSLLGSGNIEISTYQPFPNTWVTNSTINAFCASVDSDETANKGMAYLGELTCSDLPFNGNADAVVEIMDGTGTSDKVIHVVITSGNISPYRWEYTYWGSGSHVSGWVSWIVGPYVEGSSIKSTGATAGQFLVADANGGAAWTTIPNVNGQSF